MFVFIIVQFAFVFFVFFFSGGCFVEGRNITKLNEVVVILFVGVEGVLCVL